MQNCCEISIMSSSLLIILIFCQLCIFDCNSVQYGQEIESFVTGDYAYTTTHNGTQVNCPEGCTSVKGGGCFNNTKTKFCCNDYFSVDTGCVTYCKAENDTNGHYTCDPVTGQKICLPFYYNIAKNCTQYCKPRNFFTCDPMYGWPNCVKPICGLICVPPRDAGWYCNRDGRLQCKEHHYGPQCDVICPPCWPSCDRESHFRCSENGTASCQSKFSGPDCNCSVVPWGHYKCNPKTGTVICDDGWVGEKCDCDTGEVHKAYHCDNSTGDKTCNPDYYGPDCDYCKPPVEQMDYYECDNQTGAKICFTGFYGDNCTTYCNNETDHSYGCNGDGSKICAQHWYGADCTIFCSPTKQYSCDQSTGEKICNSGFAGEQCNNPVKLKYFVPFVVMTVICVLLLIVIFVLLYLYYAAWQKKNKEINQNSRLFVNGRFKRNDKVANEASYARRDSRVILSPALPTRARDPCDTLPPAPPLPEPKPVTPTIETTSFGESELWKYVVRHYDRPPHQFLHRRGTNDTFVPGLDDVGFERMSVGTSDSFHLKLEPTQSAHTSFSKNSNSNPNLANSTADMEDPLYEEIKSRSRILNGDSSESVLLRLPQTNERAGEVSLEPNGASSNPTLDPLSQSAASFTSMDLDEVLDKIAGTNRLSGLSGVSGLSSYQWDGPPSKSSTMPRLKIDEDNWSNLNESYS